MVLLEGISTNGRYGLLAVTIFVLLAFLYGVHYWNEHYRKLQPDILATKSVEEEPTAHFDDEDKV